MQQITYVGQSIGEEYKNWGEESKGEIILIKAPTGTGKSHLIFYNLLGEAVERKKRILYLVNRRILKKQIKEELENQVERQLYKKYGYSIDVSDYISVRTYQSIEKSIKQNLSIFIYQFGHFDFVVYDECHYFYTESNYNTNTQLSYEFLRRRFIDKVQIFMSATMDGMENKIKNWKYAYLSEEEQQYKNQCHLNSILGKNQNCLREYYIKKNYDYIEPQIFDDMKTLVDLIKNSKNKWLIFTDGKEKGQSIKKELINGNDKGTQDVVYIDANYEKDEEAKQAVSEIGKTKHCNRKIIITTAVMDVGVSFHDIELRNIVILADTEDEFIQMLGRKRSGAEKVKLYICKRNVKHFTRRYQQVKSILEFYDLYKNEFEGIYERNTSERYLINGYEHLYYKVFPSLEKPMDSKVVSNYYNTFSYPNILQRQQSIMELIINDTRIYEKVKTFCYFVDGLITINEFSVERLKRLKVYYQDMIDKLKCDEDAFLREQLVWLGKEGDELEEILTGLKCTLFETNKNSLKTIIEEVLNKKMTKKEAIDWKKDKLIRDYLKYFYKIGNGFKDGEGKVPDDITKTDRPIQPDTFNICMEQANLPFLMKKKSTEFMICEKV